MTSKFPYFKMGDIVDELKHCSTVEHWYKPKVKATWLAERGSQPSSQSRSHRTSRQVRPLTIPKATPSRILVAH